MNQAEQISELQQRIATLEGERNLINATIGEFYEHPEDFTDNLPHGIARICRSNKVLRNEKLAAIAAQSEAEKQRDEWRDLHDDAVNHDCQMQERAVAAEARAAKLQEQLDSAITSMAERDEEIRELQFESKALSPSPAEKGLTQ